MTKFYIISNYLKIILECIRNDSYILMCWKSVNYVCRRCVQHVLRVDFNGHGQSVSDTRPRRVQGVTLSDTDTG